MKKPLFLVLLVSIISVTSVSGQGLQAGIKGSLNSTWLFNNHVSDAPATEQTYVPSFGQSYGLSAALFFSKKIGIEMNFFFDTHRQKYTDDGDTYESETKMNRLAVPLMFKFRSETGAYFELGVIYNSVTRATYTQALDTFLIERDITDNLAKTSFDAMFGIGVDIDIVGGLSFTTALRFWGSLTDLKGVDAYGSDLSDPLVLAQDYDGKGYEQTRAASAGFLIGLTYSIGKLAGKD